MRRVSRNYYGDEKIADVEDVTPRMRRVSRNIAAFSVPPFVTVTPRMRRVSRNLAYDLMTQANAQVTPRMRRVSRNLTALLNNQIL